MNISVHRELAWKLARLGGKFFFEKNTLTVKDCECNTPAAMANQRSPDKRILTMWLPRTLFVRLQKEAEKRRETLSEVVTSLITHATQNITLSPEDYRRIADETEQATKRLSPGRAGRKAGEAR